VESSRTTDDGDLVRCLDCGTVYRQPASEREADVCPNCGYVGWIALSVEQTVPDRDT
jgi:predicted  nucleic acid-binding Zn-ribbon protein